MARRLQHGSPSSAAQPALASHGAAQPSFLPSGAAQPTLVSDGALWYWFITVKGRSKIIGIASVDGLCANVDCAKFIAACSLHYNLALHRLAQQHLFSSEEAAKPRCCTARVILQQRRNPRLSRSDPSKAMPVLHSLVHQLSEDVPPTIMPVLHSLALQQHFLRCTCQCCTAWLRSLI